jgi:hypothetical protein
VLEEILEHVLKYVVGVRFDVGISGRGQLSHDRSQDKRAEPAKKFVPCRLPPTDAFLDERIGRQILPLDSGTTVIVRWQRLPSRENIGSEQ